MVTESLCRCICGSSKDQLDSHRAWGETPRIADALEKADEPRQPKIVGCLSYAITIDQPLRGAPIREGELWHLSTEDKVESVNFALYVNGFSFGQDEQDTHVSLSPFSLVRNCKFQSAYPSLNLASFKIFKISLFCQGLCYYFGVQAQDEHCSEEERSRWVLDISRAMRLVTQSLFPPFTIRCDPVGSVATTHRRLMAGYLIHHDDENTASVLYCELHPHCGDRAKLVLYENELCEAPVLDVYLTERSLCCEKIGINCSCFSVEDHQFSTRTLSERKLWLRAISNLKVKLQNRAPSPTSDDIRHYRHAIKEHLSTMTCSNDATAPKDALLQRSLQRPASWRDGGRGLQALAGPLPAEEGKPEAGLALARSTPCRAGAPAWPSGRGALLWL